MSDRDKDRHIQERFRRTREYYDSLTPSFREVLARPLPSHRLHRVRRTVRLLAAGFALAAVISAAGYLVRHKELPSQPGAADFPALSNWHSPTDFLLKTPGDELLKTTPSIPSALPDFATLQKLETPSGSVR